MRYWSGPYDGELTVNVSGAMPGTVDSVHVMCLPLKPRHDEAGLLIIAPIGAHELYQWCPSHRRFEWRGTRWPGKVDA